MNPNVPLDRPSLESAIRRSFGNIEANGVDTYDPFDVYGMPSIQKLMDSKGTVASLQQRALYLGTRFAPILLRRILRTPKHAAAGGVAALAMAYTAAGGEQNLEKAKTHLQWLQHTATRKDSYIGWGFPYAWKNEGALLPPGTPIGHTTMTCGNAFLRYYEATGEEWAIETVLAACEFFDRGLNKSRRASGSIALSYTPVDQSQIINVSADAASLLSRAGTRTGKTGLRALAAKLIEFVLETQNNDGSWYYYAFDSIGRKTMIDNRHTGMVLSAFVEALPNLDASLQEKIASSLDRGVSYFLEHLITHDGLPKFFHDRTYPVEIYNFAQSIITLLDIQHASGLNPSTLGRSKEQLHKLARNAIDLMQRPDGGFLYIRQPFWKAELRSLRWADALMTFALVRYFNEQIAPGTERDHEIARAA